MFIFFNWEKNLFWTNKKFVYLIFINKLLWYHPKIMYKNIVQKDMNKFHIYLNWNFFAFLPRNWLTFLPWYLRTTLFRDRFVLGRTGLSWNLLARFFGNLPRNLFTHLKVGMYVRSDTMKPKWFWIQIWWYQTLLII